MKIYSSENRLGNVTLFFVLTKEACCFATLSIITVIVDAPSFSEN